MINMKKFVITTLAMCIIGTMSITYSKAEEVNPATDVPTAPPLTVNTPVPTEEPTPEPTEEPTPTPTPKPKDVKNPKKWKLNIEAKKDTSKVKIKFKIPKKDLKNADVEFYVVMHKNKKANLTDNSDYSVFEDFGILDGKRVQKVQNKKGMYTLEYKLNDKLKKGYCCSYGVSSKIKNKKGVITVVKHTGKIFVVK